MKCIARSELFSPTLTSPDIRKWSAAISPFFCQSVNLACDCSARLIFPMHPVQKHNKTVPRRSTFSFSLSYSTTFTASFFFFLCWRRENSKFPSVSYQYLMETKQKPERMVWGALVHFCQGKEHRLTRSRAVCHFLVYIYFTFFADVRLPSNPLAPSHSLITDRYACAFVP